MASAHCRYNNIMNLMNFRSQIILLLMLDFTDDEEGQEVSFGAPYNKVVQPTY